MFKLGKFEYNTQWRNMSSQEKEFKNVNTFCKDCIMKCKQSTDVRVHYCPLKKTEDDKNKDPQFRLFD